MNVPKHVVAVAGLVVNDFDQVLVIRNLRHEWEFPGGQVEQGESLIEALKREVLEETGILISVGELTGIYSNVQSHILMLHFLCKPIGGDLRTSSESLEVEWVDRTKVLSRISLPVVQSRMRDMLEYNGQVIYRAYKFDTGPSQSNYEVCEECSI